MSLKNIHWQQGLFRLYICYTAGAMLALVFHAPDYFEHRRHVYQGLVEYSNESADLCVSCSQHEKIDNNTAAKYRREAAEYRRKAAEYQAQGDAWSLRDTSLFCFLIIAFPWTCHYAVKYPIRWFIVWLYTGFRPKKKNNPKESADEKALLSSPSEATFEQFTPLVPPQGSDQSVPPSTAVGVQLTPSPVPLRRQRLRGCLIALLITASLLVIGVAYLIKETGNNAYTCITADKNRPATDSPSAKGEQMLFTCREGNYQIAFPVKPKFQKIALPAPDMFLHSYTCQNETMMYGVQYTDNPFEVTDEERQTFLIGQKEGVLKSVGGRLLYEKKITLDGWEGLEIQYEYENTGYTIQARRRFLYVGSRMYSFYCAGLNTLVNSDQMDSFLNSFRLLSASNLAEKQAYDNAAMRLLTVYCPILFSNFMVIITPASYNIAQDNIMIFGYLYVYILFIVTVSISLAMAILANARLGRKTSHNQSFLWGYFQAGLSILSIIAAFFFGTYQFIRAGSNDPDRAAEVVLAVLNLIPSFFAFLRYRWAWIIFTIFTCNPILWLINGIYGFINRRELKRIRFRKHKGDPQGDGSPHLREGARL